MFSNLLDARKKQLKNSLAMVSVIRWACRDPAVLNLQDLDCVHVEGFVHASTQIRLGSLQRVLPEKQITDAGEIVQAAFEIVNPGPGKGHLYHLTIK